jgi:hypothetical protein
MWDGFSWSISSNTCSCTCSEPAGSGSFPGDTQNGTCS